MNILSLFDGMSCGQIALNRVGIKYDNYFASEIDKHAIKVTQHNYPNTIQLGSVVDVKGENLPKIDLMFGGSPCQSFSFAGKRNGMSTIDDIEITTLEQYLDLKDHGFEFNGQSYLFWEYVRILHEVKPKYFLLENVKMAKKWKDVISKTLGTQPIEINSNLVSAQNRQRLYWTNIPNITLPSNHNITFDDINDGDETWLDDDFINKVQNWNARQDPLKCAIKIGKNKKIPCLTARGYNQCHSGMVLVTNGKKFRYLTNSEAELAQNIPIGYTTIAKNVHRSHMI